MTNNSGKFISQVSNVETEMTATDIAPKVPETPKVSLLHSVEEYLGKFWWVWLFISLLIVKRK